MTHTYVFHMSDTYMITHMSDTYMNLIYDNHICVSFDYPGRRGYTMPELERIYVDTARECFAAIEALLEYADSKLTEKRWKPMKQGYVGPNGKLEHALPETDSDGDGGSAAILRGRGFIEFSQKGIPHGSLHFPELLKWAGHIFMHDTCAPEASHRTNIKMAMDRVRKLSDAQTASSMIEWVYRVHTYAKIISAVIDNYLQQPDARRPRRKPKRNIRSSVMFPVSKKIKPNHDFIRGLHGDTFSPLRAGKNHMLSPDVRVSYHEVGQIYDSHI